MKNQLSFTLIELLIVIGTLAVLATVAVLVLNPQELIKQARDTQRMADLTTLNKALAVYQSSGQMSLGTANTVYVSISSSQTNCSNLGLPTLPSGYTYACVPSSTLQKADGTGWIPLAFTSVSYGTPLEKLPVDPVNSTSTRNYYTYMPGGSWELTAAMESAKYKMGGAADTASKDGGPYPELYEEGTNLTLLPIDYGDSSLVGYWKLDEGSGTSAYDSSGNNATGTWYGTGTHWVSGKIGSYSGQFNGSDDFVSIGSPSVLDFGSGDFTYAIWVNSATTTAQTFLAEGCPLNSNKYGAQIRYNVTVGATPQGTHNSTLDAGFGANAWHYVALVRSGDNWSNYVDGIKSKTTSLTGSISNSDPFEIGRRGGCNDSYTKGLIDDVRVYNRALSATEIAAIYNATK